MTLRSARHFSAVFALVSAFAAASAAETVPSESFKVESNLRAGVAKTDITPPPDAKTVGHVRETRGARDPIRAAVLLLDDGRTRAAIVTLDLLCSWDEMVKSVRAEVSKAAAIAPRNILVATSHNHSGPGWPGDASYGRTILEKIAAAAAGAVQEMRPVSLGYGEGQIGLQHQPPEGDRRPFGRPARPRRPVRPAGQGACGSTTAGAWLRWPS